MWMLVRSMSNASSKILATFFMVLIFSIFELETVNLSADFVLFTNIKLQITSLIKFNLWVDI